MNRAIWFYAIWIALYNFQMFVNTIIWHDNVDIVAQVWCDIGVIPFLTCTYSLANRFLCTSDEDPNQRCGGSEGMYYDHMYTPLQSNTASFFGSTFK